MNGRCLHRPVTGVERYASELIKRLASRVTVVEPAGARDGLRGHLWEQWTLPGLVEGALLWCPANTGPLTVACQVVTIHDVSPLDHPEWFHPAFARWYRVLLPALGRKVRRILTDSAFSRHRIVETLGVPADRVVAIPCGVDARFSPAAPESIDAVRRRYSLPRRYLLTVGSLQPRKNLSRLFEAWASVRLHVTGIELAVIGAGRHTFRSPAIGRIPDGVRLLGRVDDADLPALYSGAIAAVVPSLYEGFGLTALEAMACGTPVVAATGSALDEVAADVTVRIDPTSTSSLRDGLQMVIDDDGLRQRLATAGRDRARGYTWERTATATWQVLEAASGD